MVFFKGLWLRNRGNHPSSRSVLPQRFAVQTITPTIGPSQPLSHMFIDSSIRPIFTESQWNPKTGLVTRDSINMITVSMDTVLEIEITRVVTVKNVCVWRGVGWGGVGYCDAVWRNQHTWCEDLRKPPWGSNIWVRLRSKHFTRWNKSRVKFKEPKKCPDGWCTERSGQVAGDRSGRAGRQKFIFIWG